MIDNWSNSKIAMLSRCPRQFWYRYILGWKIPPGAALQFGLSYHRTMKANADHRIQSGRDMSLEQVKDIFVDEWKRDAAEIEWEFEEKDNQGHLGDRGVALIGNYMKEVSPNREPKLAEYKFEITLPEIDKPFIGVIDLVAMDSHGDDYLVDHKTSNKRWAESRAHSELQPTAYYLSFIRLFDKEPSFFLYDVAPKTGKAEIQVIGTARTEHQIGEYIQRIDVAQELLSKDIYPKTDPGNWYCSEKWCGYYNHCMRGWSLSRLRMDTTEDITDAL